MCCDWIIEVKLIENRRFSIVDHIYKFISKDPVAFVPAVGSFE